MRLPILRFPAAFILGLCIPVLLAGVATAQVKKGKSRVMTTAQLMKAVIKPSSGTLKKGLETAPASDEAGTSRTIRRTLSHTGVSRAHHLFHRFHCANVPVDDGREMRLGFRHEHGR